MVPAWTSRAVLGACLLACACKSSAPLGFEPASDAGGGPTTVTFAYGTNLTCASGGLCAPPSQLVTLGIVSSVDGSVEVALAGDYADAALTASTVSVVGGRAQLALETSSTPASFSILARPSGSGSAQATVLSVAVGASGFAKVLAVPSYAGNRTADAFLATTVVLSTCAAIDAASEGDAGASPAPVPWLTEPSGTPIALSVPADERFAVEVRVGHYITGCADVSPLAATTTSTVPVTAYDVPMALGQTNMKAAFDSVLTTAQSNAWQAAMTSASSAVVGAFFATGSDGTALLDAMAALIPSNEQTAFAQARATGSWDTATGAWLTAHAPSMHDRAAAWLTTAASDGFGELVLHLGPGSSTGTDTLTVTSFGQLTGAATGITIPLPFAWSADADDTVHLAGSVTLAALTYIRDEADSHAASDVTGASDVPSALALQIDCAGLAASLVGSGDSYGTCAASCTADLCVQALATAWANASASSGTNADLQMSLTVGTPAEVGDDAEPIYFDGSWLGQVSGALLAQPLAVGGTVEGLKETTP